MAAPNRQMRRQAEREQRRADRKTATATTDGKATTRKPTTAEQAKAAAAAAAAAGVPQSDDGAPPLSPDNPAIKRAMEQALAGTGIDPDGLTPQGQVAATAGEKKPRGRPRKDGSSGRSPKFVALERDLAEMLAMPGGPALAMGDQFCGQHFMVQGPIVAAQLCRYAESHSSTYNMLRSICDRGGLLIIITAIAGFILPPLVHHGLPVPEAMRESMLGNSQAAHNHSHG